MNSSTILTRNSLLGRELVRALEDRFFDAYYCECREDAIAKALSLIKEGSTVTWGGSQTIRDIGLVSAVKNGNFIAYDRDDVPPSQKAEFAKKHFFSDVYLTSVNALTEDGILFNIDGRGNRVASMIYGPESVIVVVGINKVVKDLDAAISRARNTAAPINAQRFDIKTPCKITGKCADCKSADCICSYMVTTRLCNPPKKIKVIIVGENLGF